MSKFGNLVRKTLGLVENSYSYYGGRTSLPSINKSWNKTDFLKANEISLYTSKALEKRAEKVGEIEFQLKQGDKIIEKHWVIDLLYKPNKLFSGVEFWKLYQLYKDITGEAYILKISGQGELFSEKKVTELHLLRPDLMDIRFAATGEIEKFIYKAPGGDDKFYEANEIIYSWRPNPLNPLRGISLLKSGIKAIITENEIAEYHAKILKNGGKVEGVFNFKSVNNLSKQQLEDMKEQYYDHFSGSKNVGKPLFLGGDVEYRNVGLSPTELSYLEAKKISLDDISIMTSVPKALLANISDVKFDNADASRHIFYRDVVYPLDKSLATALDLHLVPKELDLVAIDPTPENTEEKRKNLETGNSVNALTQNEKREILGLDPIPDGDKILVPFNLVPYDLIAKPREQREEEAKKKEMDEYNHPYKDEFVRDAYRELHIKKADKAEEQFEQIIQNYFKAQEKRLIDEVTGAKQFRKKGLLEENYDIELQVSLAKEKFFPFLQQTLKEAGIAAMGLVESTHDFVLSSNIKSWLQTKVEVFSRSINETTFTQLQTQFKESLEAGESRKELVQRIKDTYKTIDDGRAKTIARTEINSATQYGTMQGYKQANVPIKIWVAVKDLKTRDSHWYLDGQEKPIDMPFSNGLMFPGDPGGRPEEVINCRCTV